MKPSTLLLILKIILVGLFTLFFAQLQARNNDLETLRTSTNDAGLASATSIYFELGGKLFPSLNIDFRKSENFAVSLGTGFWSDSEEHKQYIFIPSVNAYYLVGKRNRIEIGGGTGTFLSTYEGMASLLVFGNVGYRYQKKMGLIFRAGFTPFVAIPICEKSRFVVMPWIGLSLGYSF